MDQLDLEIAGVWIRLLTDRPRAELALNSAYREFMVDGSDRDEQLVVRIRCRYLAHVPERPSDARLEFSSGALWTLYSLPGSCLFELRSERSEPFAYRSAVFDASFSDGEIVSDPAGMSGASSGGTGLPDPLEYPLGELFMMCRLGLEGGLMVHGCGIADGGRGLLFLGHSGRGKTTVARLWSAEGARVLNDDRVVLRHDGERFWMYGTPWHGDLSEVSSEPVKLEGIFLLGSHGRFEVSPRGGPGLPAIILAHAFLPMWSKAGMAMGLATAHELVAKVSCYDLSFRPEGRAVELIRNAG